MPHINFGRKKGKNSRVAQPRRTVATKNGSTPERVLPIKPKEKAHMKDTMARYNISSFPTP
jgi:hypothetical protein